MTKQIVINCCHGGFSLSREAFLFLRGLKHPMALEETDIGECWKGTDEVREPHYSGFLSGIERDDPLLIQVVLAVGEINASGPHASLKIVEIPDGVKWQIEEYDGLEHVAEKHRTWW
jgi:hypothetical protein